MRLFFVLLVAFVGSPVLAEDKPRFVERTPIPHVPAAHTHERAGTTLPFSKHAQPSVSPHEAGGYVGGGGVRGVRTAYGVTNEGTFGWDYVGFGRKPGRVFLGFLNGTGRQTSFYGKYLSEGPKVPDPVAAQPFKKAVKEAAAEKRGGSEH